MDSLHALSRLPGDIYELDYLEVGLQDVNVFVEAAALTPLGHDGQIILRHVAHKQQDVYVSCFSAAKVKTGRLKQERRALSFELTCEPCRRSPQDGHFVPERLELLWCGVGHL